MSDTNQNFKISWCASRGTSTLVKTVEPHKNKVIPNHWDTFKNSEYDISFCFLLTYCMDPNYGDTQM